MQQTSDICRYQACTFDEILKGILFSLKKKYTDMRPFPLGERFITTGTISFFLQGPIIGPLREFDVLLHQKVPLRQHRTVIICSAHVAHYETSV